MRVRGRVPIWLHEEKAHNQTQGQRAQWTAEEELHTTAGVKKDSQVSVLSRQGVFQYDSPTLILFGQDFVLFQELSNKPTSVSLGPKTSFVIYKLRLEMLLFPILGGSFHWHRKEVGNSNLQTHGTESISQHTVTIKHFII